MTDPGPPPMTASRRRRPSASITISEPFQVMPKSRHRERISIDQDSSRITLRSILRTSSVRRVLAQEEGWHWTSFLQRGSGIRSIYRRLFWLPCFERENLPGGRFQTLGGFGPFWLLNMQAVFGARKVVRCGPSAAFRPSAWCRKRAGQGVAYSDYLFDSFLHAFARLEPLNDR